MANQVDPATVGGAAAGGATATGAVAAAEGPAGVHSQDTGSVATATNIAQLGPYPSFHGRKVSWVAVAIIVIGFLVAGLSLIFGHHGPTWWLFWTGAGIAVLGFLVTIATNTFEDWY